MASRLPYSLRRWQQCCSSSSSPIAAKTFQHIHPPLPAAEPVVQNFYQVEETAQADPD